MSLSEAKSAYRDTSEGHRRFWDSFGAQVEATPWLKQHRDFVEKGQFGYGERPFHWAWKLLIDVVPSSFRFLEIGVFQGQTLSLAGLCAQKAGKRVEIWGISPLDSTGDKYCTHPNIDYVAAIGDLHEEFRLPAPKLMQAFSFDPRVQAKMSGMGPWHIVYVDGCHDYEVALDDIESYAPMVAPGGFLVVDDAACDLNIPDGLITKNWKGLADVTCAVKDSKALKADFTEAFCVGHLRVFQKRT